jgi:lipoprotein LprG
VRTRLLSVLAAALLLAGCQGDSDEPKADSAALQKRLSAARTTIDEAETIRISLAARSLPAGATGLLSATGEGNHSPAFKGKVKVVTGGATLSADVVSAGGTLKAKTSFSPVYLKIDPASLQAPDPATLLDAESGITQILEETQALEEGEESRDGSDVLTSINGSLPGSVVKSIIPSADTASSFNVTYRLTEDDQLRDASMTGRFYPDTGHVTYLVKITTSDKPVTITVP